MNSLKQIVYKMQSAQALDISRLNQGTLRKYLNIFFTTSRGPGIQHFVEKRQFLIDSIKKQTTLLLSST